MASPDGVGVHATSCWGRGEWAFFSQLLSQPSSLCPIKITTKYSQSGHSSKTLKIFLCGGVDGGEAEGRWEEEMAGEVGGEAVVGI